MTRNSTKAKRKTSGRAMTQLDRLMLERLDRFPLASANNIAALCNDEYKSCHDILQSLQRKGPAGGMDAGYSQRRQPRYWVNARGAGQMDHDPQPKRPGLVHSLLKRITLTESVYLIIAAALAAEPERKLRDFQWRFDPAVDAAVRFNDGWMAFKWSGIWRNQTLLTDQMESLHHNLRAWRPGGNRPFPGRICFVVPDAWQAELVRRVVTSFGPSDLYLIHQADSQQTEGNYDLSRSRSRPPPPDLERWSRRPDRLDDTMRRLMEREDAKALIRCLSTTEQWPGVPRSALKDLTRLNGKSITTSLQTLAEMGLMWQVEHGGYAVDDPWLSIAAERDRVWSGRPNKMFGREKVAALYAGRIANHEIGAMKLVSWFAAEGCPVAPGWRFRDVMGHAGQIAPDGMVYIENSPFGPSWFYLEYELSATTPSRVAGKMRAYHSHLRSDDFPVLVVCRRKALPHFLQECVGIRALIAPVEDVRRKNAIGDSGTVWLLDGQPVPRLGK